MKGFFFSDVSKQLIPNVYFISNQHPFYVRWGDKICNYREAAKLWLSCFPRQPCPQTQGLGKSSWHEKKKKRQGEGTTAKNGVWMFTASIPFALPQNISFFFFFFLIQPEDG